MNEMDRLADLKTELYPTEPPGERLRERALSGVPAPRPVWVRPTLVAAGVAVLAAAGLTAAALGPQSNPNRSGIAMPPPAAVENLGFTMRLNADGSVEFTATDLVDPAAATAALNSAGIAGRVVVHRDACQPVNWDDVAVPPHFTRATATPPHKPGIMGNETATLRSSDYPPSGGLLVVIVVRQYPEGTWAHVTSLGYFDVNKIPTCVQLFDPGTGADPQH